MKINKLIFTVLGMIGLLATACQPEPIQDYQYGETAIVESVEVSLLESFPVQAQAVISGQLPDGCTEVDEIAVIREDQVFKVRVKTRRPTDMVCTQALIPFEETVALDVAGLDAGTYTVIVQDQEATFTLDVDNVLD